MTLSATFPTASAREGFAFVRRNAGWILRWLLILVISLDQISSPLHRHHHDSDVDDDHAIVVVAHGLAEQGDSAQAGETVASTAADEVQSDGVRFGHSVTVLRMQAGASLDDRCAASAALIVAVLALVFPEVALDLPTLVWPEHGPPDFSSFKSLPPAGRAPPLHA